MRSRRRPCFNPRCHRTVPGRYLSCLPCWRQIPEALQLAILCTGQRMEQLGPRVRRHERAAAAEFLEAHSAWRGAVDAARVALSTR